MKKGKIASLRLPERGGHRLRAAPERVAWFAPERPWRQGRPARRYRVLSARAPRRGNAGGTAEGLPFVPNQLGGKAFLLHRSPPSRHGSCVNTAKGVADMKETLETIRREALSAGEVSVRGMYGYV